ncbi:MAG: transketolase C-terminal domain-containing protein [Candidatus Eisenbacteria bacterium]
MVLSHPGAQDRGPVDSTHDARFARECARGSDPVLFYEHIALYRDPQIKQILSEEPPAALPIGRAALRRSGTDLVLVSYGAYVHVCLRVAQTLAGEGVDAAVLDLRTLAPLDRDAILALARHRSRPHRARRHPHPPGGIGESIAAVIQEEAFSALDAPVAIVGSLDTPVPYSPSLEEAFLPGEHGIEQAARALLAY